MVLATLDIPYVDTTAADLVWTLDHPIVPSLAMTAIEFPELGARLELRVLGASHQVVWRGTETGIVETVACLPGHRPYLPGVLERRIGTHGYRFRARVEHVSAAEIGARVDGLRRSASASASAEDDDAGDGDDSSGSTVVAAFPSDPNAITALCVSSGAAYVGWDTWHVYPKVGQIVTTGTVLYR